MPAVVALMPMPTVDDLFRQVPIALATFGPKTGLRRYNALWLSYVRAYNPAATDSPPAGTPFGDLLPGTEANLGRFIRRALSGETVRRDSLRLVGDMATFYWDITFTPWPVGGGVMGFLFAAVDTTDRVLSRQLLERRVADRTRKLSALYEILAAAARSADVQDVLDASLQHTIAATHASAGAIQFLDVGDEQLLLVAQSGLDDVLVTRMTAMPRASAPFDLRLLPRPEQKPTPLPGARDAVPPLLEGSRLRVWSAVPLRIRGRQVGILSIFRDHKRPFSRDDDALLVSIADQIASVLEQTGLRLENEKLLVVRERNRLARELHDAVTQSLYSLTLFAETSKRLAESGQSAALPGYLDRVADTAQQALREMRLLVHNLRPSALQRAGLVAALQQRLDAVEGRAGIQYRLDVQGDLSLPGRVEEALYHLAQEALNNALKHAGAAETAVALKQEGRLITLTVTDNGHGFDLEEARHKGGLGLTSMRERVDLFDGLLEIETAPGTGTTVRVCLDAARAGDAAGDRSLIDLIQQVTDGTEDSGISG